jgi:hypothetical protein
MYHSNGANSNPLTNKVKINLYVFGALIAPGSSRDTLHRHDHNKRPSRAEEEYATPEVADVAKSFQQQHWQLHGTLPQH